jgi:signal transduction histidine kinase
MTSSLHDPGPVAAAHRPNAATSNEDIGLNARINGWMRRWSWAVAMTVAIVITVGGLVILESGRMRIASEYETALDAKGATTQLTELAGNIASLNADERAFRLTPDPAYAAHYLATSTRLHDLVASLDGYYGRKADTTALDSFNQVAAMLNARIARGVSGHAAPESTAGTDVLDNALALLRLNEERRAQSALDASRADQRISTFCVGALCALNIVLFLLLFRNLGIQLDKQDRVQETLITQQEELDQLVFDRTRQLEALAWHLQSVSENEKTQLARELHDELGAILTASKMDVAWVNNKLKSAEPVMSDKLGRALANLDQGIALKRRIIEDMRPTVLTNFGLVTALRTLADEAAQRNGWVLSITLPDDDIKLGEEVEIALFRVAQESLTNAAKYAKAASVLVELELDEARVTLHIADDGVGIRREDLSRTHTHGLLGMRQRVSARGGRIEIKRRTPKGTDIRVTMPRVRG